MSSLTFSNQDSLLSFLRENLQSDRTISIRAMAKLCGVADKSIINGGSLNSVKLAEKLTEQGFDAGSLIDKGFNAQATWLTIEYFAYESKAEAPQAKALARTFGTIGVMQTFSMLQEETKPEFEIPQTYSAALMLAAKQAETIELQQQKIALDAPYTAMGQILEQATGELTIGEYSKVIGIGRNKLFDLLRDKGILSKTENNKNEPYQRFIDSGYFRCVEKDTRIGLKLVPLVTPKGQIWIQKQLTNVLVLRSAV